MYRRQDSSNIAAMLEPYARGDRTCCRTSRCINTLCDSAPGKLERLKSCVRGLNSIYYAGNQLTAVSWQLPSDSTRQGYVLHRREAGVSLRSQGMARS